MRRPLRPPVEKRHLMLLTLVALLAAPVLPAVGITFTTDTTINTTQYVGQDIVVQSCTLTIDCSSGIGNYNSITLNSGVLTHPAGSANGLWLNIAGTVAVDPWSQINVNGRGHQGGTGPGVGSVAGAGGTYGGTGVGTTTPVYGSYSMPAELGSGGAARPGHAGGAGGGLIRITCGGTFDNQGVIYALGNNATAAGAGSGGGVYIACDTYAGGGFIQADGGDVDTSGVPANEVAGGGGGGRVALHYAVNTNSGQVYCRGGYGVNLDLGLYGGPGTRYRKMTGLPSANLDFWNEGRYGWTRQPAIDATDVNLSVISGYVEFDCSANPINVNTMHVLSGSITHPPADEDGLRIVTVGDMHVDSWASVNVDGRGHPADTGPGAGSGPGAGGTYGGTGLGSTAPVNGSWATPQELGSGGATNGADTGGSGGGRIQLDVGGTLTLEGNMRARGSNAVRAGAGAGGAVYVTCTLIQGGGFMLADGGDVDNSGLPADQTAGGGGGGRVALHYGSSTYTGSVWSRGGWGVVAGTGYYAGPGTRYWLDDGAGTKSLDFYNEGRGGWTMQPALSIPDTDLNLYYSNVEFDCGLQPLSVKKLSVLSSTISHPAGSAAGLDIATVGDMHVDWWASVNVDGRGHPSNSGPGAGTAVGSGATYGGTGVASDAAVYGSFSNPTDLGSGGVNNGADLGGSGGGRIQLSVGGTLTLEGNLRSRGSNALRAGAGSGGTIQVTCGTLTSSGFMLADGGDVDNSGLPADQTAGGGGGGRVALHYGSSTYTGSVWSRGGWGVVAGTGYYAGPGTRYWLDDGAGTKSLDFYNEGRGGWTNQPALSIPDTDLNLYSSNVAFDCGLQPLSVKKLGVLSSTISHPAGSAAGLDIVVVEDMLVDWWASVNVDGRGHASNSGPGAGTAVGSGATYGGTGLASDAAVYGSFSNPTDPGSGGVNNGADLGGSGGGRIQLAVGGTLTLEGNLRSRGSNALRAGAGSGGTIQVTCGTLTSSGYMLADGGDADVSGLPAEQTAGGGGGGRIALLYGSSTFTGTVWSRGGWGAVAGSGYYAGPGTRYWEDFGASSKTLDFWNEGRGGWTKQPALSVPDVHFNLYSCNVELDCSLQRMAVRTLGLYSSVLSHPPASPEGLQVIAGDTIYVDNWSQINAEGRGLPAEVGSGRGTNGAGGGYGGVGGYNTLTYGAREMPLHLGSGGGNNPGGTGGVGGGRISLTTAGTIQLDGQILARGGDAPSDGGGGSGGSVLLVANDVIGGGLIYAYGGTANYQATNVGGGGGGRVAVYTNPGQAWWPGGGINVDGGWGIQYGAVGTIYHGETVAGTDLQLTEDFQWEWQADGSGQGTVTVFNVGNTGCGAFKVGLYDRDPALSGAVLMDTADVPSLGAVDGVSVDLTAPTPVTSNTLWVKVDYENGVTETNELNNVRFFTIPRIGSSLFVLDRTGTIGELVSLRGKLKRITDNAWLPGKTVHFKVDGTLVGSGVTDAVGLAEYLWVIDNGPASRTVNGAFYGDAEYSPCTDDGTLNAQTWQTKMSGIDRTGPIASYRILKAWLWKMDNTPIPGKSILFKLDGTVLGSDNTRPTGYAQIGYTIADGAGAGVRTVRSEWVGDGGYLPSAVNSKLTVTKATPYIWVMPRTVPQGGIARFYAYFRRLPDYQKQAGKTVSFKIDGTWIVDVVTLTGAEAGIARYNYTTVESVGDHTLRCEFAGDAWVDAGYGEGLLRILAP